MPEMTKTFLVYYLVPGLPNSPDIKHCRAFATFKEAKTFANQIKLSNFYHLVKIAEVVGRETEYLAWQSL